MSLQTVVPASASVPHRGSGEGTAVPQPLNLDFLFWFMATIKCSIKEMEQKQYKINFSIFRFVGFFLLIYEKIV